MKGALLLLQDRSDKRIEALAGSQVSRAEHDVHGGCKSGRWTRYGRASAASRIESSPGSNGSKDCGAYPAADSRC